MSTKKTGRRCSKICSAGLFSDIRGIQAACRALGCTPAKEVNEGLTAAEPFDVQMEYRL